MSNHESHPGQQDGSQSIIVPDDQSGSLSELLGHTGQRSIDNFGNDPRARMKLEFRCQSSECVQLRSLKGKVVAVKFYYLHPVEIVEADGQISESVRTVLVSPEGVAMQAVSTGVAKVVATLLKYFGREPIDPAVFMRVVIQKGRRGDFLTLDLVDDDDVTVDVP